jgi:hypothetical protein
MSVLSSSDECTAHYTKKLELRALYNGASWLGVSALFHLRTEADLVSETLEINTSNAKKSCTLWTDAAAGLCLKRSDKYVEELVVAGL